MQSEGAFILDVRQPDEWEEGHIEGATQPHQLENRLNEIPRQQSRCCLPIGQSQRAGP